MNSIGIVSRGCGMCGKLKNELSIRFHPVDIDFVEVVYEDNEKYAMEICDKYGFDDIPAFYIGGVVFKDKFTEEQVKEAKKNIELSNQ